MIFQNFSIFQRLVTSPATVLASAIFFSFSAPGLSAQNPASPGSDVRWLARPEIAPYTGRVLPWDELATLSLLLSGLPPEKASAYVVKLKAIAEEAKQKTAGLTPKESADVLLQFLHSSTLRTYRYDQTRVDVLLDTGVFNCVSSALVYMVIAKSLGLSVSAVATSDHAFCQVVIDSHAYDVETTTSLGFDPGNRREFHDSFGKLTGFSYVPSGNYSRRTQLDGTGLASLVLNNLIAFAQQRNDNTSPVGLAWDTYALLGTREAKDVVYHVYNNYIATYNTKGRYAQGLAVIARLEQLLGRFSITDELVGAFTHNLIVEKIQAHDYDGARSTVVSAGSRIDQNPNRWYADIFKDEVQYRYQSTPWTAFQTWIEQAGSLGASKEDIANSEETAIIMEMQKRARTNRDADWESALAFYGSLGTSWQSNRQIKSVADTYSYNLSVSYHNRFATLMNQRKKDEALTVLEEGLKRFPDSSLLLQDKARVRN